MNNKELNKLLLENRKMREALEFIKNWNLPQVECDGVLMSYEAARGSNGARNYMIHVASDGLLK